jgi:chromosome segregation ATPase
MLQKELEQKNDYISQQNKDLKGLKDIKKTLGGVTIERNNLDNSCRQLEDELMKVKEQLQLMEKQRNIALGEVKTLQVNHECEVKRISNELERVKEKTMQEKDELSLRLREMEEKSGGLKKKYKRMKKLHQTSLDEVKRLIDEATTHENQLLQEKDQLRRLAEDDHKKMTKKVQTYQKRHQQFIMLLTSSHPLHHHLHDNDNDHIISDDDINVTN